MNLRKDHYRVAYRLSSSPGSKRATVSSAQAEGPPHQFSPEIRAGARGAHAALLPRGAAGKQTHLFCSGPRPGRTGLSSPPLFPSSGHHGAAWPAGLVPVARGSRGGVGNPRPLRYAGIGPTIGTLTSARCGGSAPGRPARAPGYPTLLLPPEGA